MRDFTKEIGRREMTVFLMPLIFVKLFEVLSGTFNTMIVNRLLSADVITCISACRVYPMLQNYLLGITAAGFGLYVTRYIGGQNPEEIRKAVAQALLGCCVLSAVGSGLLLALEPLLSLVNVPADIHGQAKDYLFWLFAGSAVLVFQNFFFSLLYGMGESAFAGGVSAVGVVLQPFMTFLLVQYAGLQITAVPLAYLVNRLLLSLLMFGCLLWKYRSMFNGLSGALSNQKELWSCGFSRSLMLLFIWFGTFLIQRNVNRMPAAHISAYMYAIMAEDLLLVPVFAVQEAASAILGQNVGAGNTVLVRKYFWRLNYICWWFCLVMLGIVWLTGPSYVRFIIGPAEDEVFRLVVRWLRICAFGFAGLAIREIGRRTLQAIGAYRHMGFLGILEGILRMFLAVFVISGSNFDSLIASFFCLFVCMGAASAVCCHIALNRQTERMTSGEQDND